MIPYYYADSMEARGAYPSHFKDGPLGRFPAMEKAGYRLESRPGQRRPVLAYRRPSGSRIR